MSDESDRFAIVCTLHGGCPLPAWIVAAATKQPLLLTVNDPSDHEYPTAPVAAKTFVNAIPMGFSANTNRALAVAFGEVGVDIACVVNFDTSCNPSSLDILVRTLMAAAPDVAAVGPRLQDGEGRPGFSLGRRPTFAREILRALGLRDGRLLTAQRVLLRHTRGWSERNIAPLDGPRMLTPDEFLPWTCVALRREAWQAIGPLDERFFLYAEDTDWSWRAYERGWRLMLADVGPIVHQERATASPRTNAMWERSQRSLHAKWGERKLECAQRVALRLRRTWLIRHFAPLDWDWFDGWNPE